MSAASIEPDIRKLIVAELGRALASAHQSARRSKGGSVPRRHKPSGKRNRKSHLYLPSGLVLCGPFDRTGDRPVAVGELCELVNSFPRPKNKPVDKRDLFIAHVVRIEGRICDQCLCSVHNLMRDRKQQIEKWKG